MSLVSAIGLRWRSTSFWTYFILESRGSFSLLKILGTIRAPLSSWPWKVQPCLGWNLLVGGFAMSWRIADHLSQRLSDFSHTFSNTSNVWKKLSLWVIPFFFSTPFSATISGKNFSSNPVFKRSLKPMLGLSASIILLSSVCILSIEMISSLSEFLEIDFKLSDSITKSSCVANLIALIILRGSSL